MLSKENQQAEHFGSSFLFNVYSASRYADYINWKYDLLRERWKQAMLQTA